MEDRLLTPREAFFSLFVPNKVGFDVFCEKSMIWYKKKKSLYDFLKTGGKNGDFRKDRAREIMYQLYLWFVINVEDVIAFFWEYHFDVKSEDVNRMLHFTLSKKDPTLLLDSGEVAINGRIGPMNTRIIRNIHLKPLYQTKNHASSTHHAETHSRFNSTLCVFKRMIEEFLFPHTLIIPMGAKKILESNLAGILAILRGTTCNPSIFPPYTCSWILERVIASRCNKSTDLSLFTPCMGWNSYLVAFFNSGKYREYVGTDVIPEVIQKANGIVRYFSDLSKDSQLFLCPSERLDEEYNFGQKYKDHFDVIFFSPPYFTLEIYPGEEQSTKNFPTYEKWLRGYWEQTIQLCQKCLKPSGILGYVCGDYKDEKWKLVCFGEDLKHITQKYLSFEDEIKILWNGVTTTAAKRKKSGNVESLYLFRRKK